MAGQSQIHGGNDRDDDLPDVELGQAQISTAGVDDLLDEIDELLEPNARDFVYRYQQKGGQ